MIKTSVDSGDMAGGSLGVASAKKLYDAATVKPDKFVLTYHLNPHNGWGHKHMADQIKSGLEGHGFKVDTHGLQYEGPPSTSPIKGWKLDTKAIRKNKKQYAAHMDLNPAASRAIFRGLLSDVPELKTPSNWKTDFSASAGKDAVMPFAADKVREQNADRLRSILKERGIDTGDRKVVTLSSGGSAHGMDWKLRETARALKGRKDVDLVVLSGNQEEAIKKLVGRQKNIRVLGQLDRALYNEILSNSHLNIGHAGSSSLSDALAFSNPNMVIHYKQDGMAGENARWARTNYGMQNFALGDARDRRAFRRAVRMNLDSPVSRAAQAQEYTNITKKVNSEMVDSARKAMLSGQKKVRSRMLGKGSLGLLASAGLVGASSLMGNEKKADTEKNVMMGGLSTAGIAGAVRPKWLEFNPELKKGLGQFSTLASRAADSKSFIEGYVDEASDLIRKPIMRASALKHITLPNISRVTENWVPDSAFHSPSHRFHTRSFSRGPLEGYAQLAHEAGYGSTPNTLNLFRAKAQQMGYTADQVKNLHALPKVDQMKILSTDIGAEVDTLRAGKNGWDRVLRARMRNVPKGNYGKKLEKMVAQEKIFKGTRKGIIGAGLGAAGIAALVRGVKSNDTTKTAGGPGSGVSFNNVEQIGTLEKSPLVSIGKRRIIMMREPDYRKLVNVKDIKYRAQDKYVIKKLAWFLEHPKEWKDDPVSLLYDGTSYHIMDGHHRLVAAQRLKLEKLPAKIWLA